MPRPAAAILALFLTLAGCANNPAPANPTFPLTFDQADQALSRMAAEPRPLARPLVIIGGIWDLNLSSPFYKMQLERITRDRRMIAVSVGYCGSFDQCRQKVLDAVDAAFPNDDPAQTTEVDVIGISLGGLVGRAAAAPSPDASKPRRLNVARLFTVASPHAGATLAASLGFTQFHRDMCPGSPFLRTLADADHDAAYEIYPYVLLGDGIVGQQYAAPPDKSPIWLAPPPLQFAHAASATDSRIIADIARRLRGEKPFSSLPPAPLPQ
jgi:hypothetical protein